ncbi:MAG: tetratricopeptide repeat protein [Nitrososphaerales archaeon]
MSQGERRLAAIMYTDMVGYTALGQRDESLSLALVEEQRKLLRPIFNRHNGREVKTMGDAFLVEFPSALEAVRCAYDIQRTTREFNISLPSEKRVHLRVGVHLGDVVESQGDISGDAVNVASRIEPLAEDGGVCLTRQVYDHVQNKFELPLASLGPRLLKNVSVPLEIYKMMMPWSEEKAVPPTRFEKSRIAILPFANVSPDPNDRYFADGMTEELISTVSRIKGLSVISRSSAMRYRDTTLSMGQIGEDLRVGAVLEGSVRKSGSRVRISTQLIEVDTDRYIWSQSYDRDLTDIFQVQGEIAQEVAEGLQVHLLSEERQSLGKRATDSPEAYTLYLKGRYYWGERSKDATTKAIRYFEEAAKADPGFARAYSGLADCYAILSDAGWMPPSTAGQLAKENALRALSIDDAVAEAHASLGLVSMNHFWDFAAAEREFRRAMDLNPSYAPAYHWYAVMLGFLKKYDGAIKMIERAADLDPYFLPVDQSLGVALLEAGRSEEALERFRKIATENPSFVAVHYWMAMAYLAQSKHDEALEEGKKEAELDEWSDDSKLDLAFLQSVVNQHEAAKKILDEVLSKAGSYVSPVSVALVKLGLGHDEEGYEWLERALQEHHTSLLYFASVPFFERYRSDPRWHEIERKMGFPRDPDRRAT